jgi:hypothetical protein
MEGPQLEGRAYKPAASFGWHADPTADRAKWEWIVRGGGEVRLTARHDRAGVVRASVEL